MIIIIIVSRVVVEHVSLVGAVSSSRFGRRDSRIDGGEKVSSRAIAFDTTAAVIAGCRRCRRLEPPRRCAPRSQPSDEKTCEKDA